MFSLVLMTAMSTTGDAAAFGKKYAGCHGCSGVVVSCYGCSGCYGSAAWGGGYGTSLPPAAGVWGAGGPPPWSGYVTPGSYPGVTFAAAPTGVPATGHQSGWVNWSMGGATTFGGGGGCYSLANPVGGGFGYNVWVDPNNGPTIMPPRVGHFFHGGTFYGRLYHPFSCHGGSYRGSGYFDQYSGYTIPPHAGGNGSEYHDLYSKGGYDYKKVEDAYAVQREQEDDDLKRYTPRNPPPATGPVEGGTPPAAPGADNKEGSMRPGKADVYVSLPAGAKLFVDGKPAAGDGATRRFVTPELAGGRAFYYEMTAEYTVGGKTLTETKQVVVRAGAEVKASFDTLVAAADREAGTAVAKK